MKKPIHKFNNGRGATLCHECGVIINRGLTDDLYCEKCKNMKAEKDLRDMISKLGMTPEMNKKLFHKINNYTKQKCKEQRAICATQASATDIGLIQTTPNLTLIDMDKPIVIRVYEDNEELGTVDVVWCPFWSKKPDLEKAKAEGRLIETKSHYLIKPNESKS